MYTCSFLYLALSSVYNWLVSSTIYCVALISGADLEQELGRVLGEAVQHGEVGQVPLVVPPPDIYSS